MTESSKAMLGKICMVTGATSGIGKATALALARMGGTVIVVGRDGRKCSETVAEIRRASGNVSVEFLRANLSVQDEVRALALEFGSARQCLDVLVNNAGARFATRVVSADGYELTFALNHLAYFLLTNLLLPALKKSGGRIVNVASGAHWGCPAIDFADLQGERSFSGKMAYAQSKLANLLFTYELDRRLAGSGVTVNAADPGNVLSGFCRNNGLFGWGRHILGSLRSGGLVGPGKGASASVYLASSSEMAGKSGGYFYRERAVESSPASYDRQAARRLWKVSAELAQLRALTAEKP